MVAANSIEGHLKEIIKVPQLLAQLSLIKRHALAQDAYRVWSVSTEVVIFVTDVQLINPKHKLG